MALISHTGADAVLYGGVIREDVMDKIWNISPTETVLTSLCSKGTHSNRRVEFVQNLPDDMREAIVLCEWEEMAVAEAAAVLQSTPKAVESRLYRARNLLREQLKAWL